MKKMKYFEVLFDIVYLLFVIISGIYMITISNDNPIKNLYGMMTLVLGIGDSFHLIPRIFSIILNKNLISF